MDIRSLIDTRRRGEPDPILFMAVFLLTGLGIAMSFSASAVLAQDMYGDALYFLKRQLVWFGLGMVLMILLQYIDYRIYAHYTKLMLLFSFLFLIIVMIPGIGSAAKGTSRWISLGPANIQPSELVKIIMVIYLVKVFSSEVGPNPVVQLLIPVLVLAAAFILIMLQPDFGTAMELLFVSGIILFVSGFPLLYLLSLGVISIPTFYLLIYQVDYRRERILGFLDPWGDRFGKGYHVIQSFIAFRKGELFGTGLGLGTQKIRRLPEPHTDFIYAVIAEETGLLGTLFVLLLYMVLFWRGIVIGLAAPDHFGKLLAIGLTLLIVVQAFVNIGVVSGALPTTGIPLPFISYGGSSLLSNMAAAGILLNISRYREAAMEGIQLSEEAWS